MVFAELTDSIDAPVLVELTAEIDALVLAELIDRFDAPEVVERTDGFEIPESEGIDRVGEGGAVHIVSFLVLFFFIGGSSVSGSLFLIGTTSEALDSSAVLSKLGSGFLDRVTLEDFLTGGVVGAGDCIDFLFLLPSTILSKIFFKI